ncbi:hypothetical protein ACT3TS_15395 [Specibacter sp. AOP5-B1-6]|uniref:hypothetical protein n=1 Tax=Specibacter sp. AOP5-B1-6 TaxID=3457653 RepID=UPI00402B0CD4
MVSVSRLVSVVDTDADSRSQGVSVSVLHEAELDNGQSAPLLDDRGWNSSQPWAEANPEGIQATARVVVGPDEPHGSQTMEEAVTAYWEYLRKILSKQGIETSAAVLKAIPHDVVLSERVWGRLT